MRTKSLLCFFLFVIIFSSCPEKVEPCMCTSPEICVDGECELPEGTIRLGNRTFASGTAYLGILPERFCVDTLIFKFDVEREEYNIHTADSENSAFGLVGVLIEQPSDNQVVFGHILPYCELDNGYDLFSTVTADFFEPDSVRFNMRFWQNDTTDIVFIDSTMLTLVKF